MEAHTRRHANDKHPGSIFMTAQHYSGDSCGTPKKSLNPLRRINISLSSWVIIGFLFWLGIFLGAVMMHAMMR